MIAFLSIALFTTVSAATIADAESARVDYSNCLVDFTTAQLISERGWHKGFPVFRDNDQPGRPLVAVTFVLLERLPSAAQ